MHRDNEPRLIRTILFCSGATREGVLEEASIGTDSVCIDLEGSTPDEAKDHARAIFRDVAKELRALGKVVMVRANTIDSGLCEADLDAVVCPELHCVNISKVTTADDVVRFCELLSEAEARHGVPVGYTLVRPVVETAWAIRNAYEIATSSHRIAYMGAVTGGLRGDLGRTMGLDRTPDGVESLFIRSKVLLDVRCAGVPFPIGGGPTSERTVDALRALAIQTKNLGYDGFYCPSKHTNWPDREESVRVVNEVFTPTAAEVAEWLQRDPKLEHPRFRERVEFARAAGIV